MAHENWWMLERLILMIDNIHNDIYLHIDKRAKNFPKEKFLNTCKYSKIYIFQDYAVLWGNYNQIQTELFLYKKATETQEYAFYHLLSGSDLPICSQECIHDYFSNYRGENFIQIIPMEQETAEIRRRVKYYHFFVRKSKKFNWLFSFLRRAVLLLQIFFGINRHKGIQFYYGANWSSLTHEFVTYLLEHEDWIRRTFRFVNSADEIYKQTLVMQGGFKVHSNEKSSEVSILRYIDWQLGGGSPRELSMEDFVDIMSSRAFFARKLGKDKNLVEKIIETI
jgi:hypothetical protein